MAQKHAPLKPTTPGFAATTRWQCVSCGLEGTMAELETTACAALAPAKLTDDALELEPTTVTAAAKIN